MSPQALNAHEIYSTVGLPWWSFLVQH